MRRSDVVNRAGSGVSAFSCFMRSETRSTLQTIPGRISKPPIFRAGAETGIVAARTSEQACRGH